MYYPSNDTKIVMFSSKLTEELEGSPFNTKILEDQLNTEDGFRGSLKDQSYD